MKSRTLLLLLSLASIAPSALAEDPTATAILTDVTAGGGTSYTFDVRYEDDGAVDSDSIDDHDVRVTGPGGFDVAAALMTTAIGRSSSTVTATYSITPPGGFWDTTDNGSYTVVMQDKQVFDLLGNAVHAGNLGSFNVNVSGGSTAPTTLGNISTRMLVETGDNVLIGGFIVTGTQPKKVLVRAIGPSLPVSGVLADPKLDLYSGATLLESNDNWGDSPNKQAIVDTQIPPSNSLESAIVRTLPANTSAYTAVVSGAGGGTGVGLVEVYDLDNSVDSKLANISTRGLVQTGDNVMIGGFILLGSGSQKVLVRAIGPSLSIPGKLNDPFLELHDGNGVTVESNDNWVDSSNKQAIIDTTIPPGNDAESAIVRTLSPGNYTAVVSGVAGATGVALVEVYALR